MNINCNNENEHQVNLKDFRRAFERMHSEASNTFELFIPTVEFHKDFDNKAK
jgi:hypothetical protein